jgi:glycosyltransferase involved in cell wall biosynthesis
MTLKQDALSQVLVDASNLHVGGGVQVAASFLDELALLAADVGMCRRHPWIPTTRVEASPCVMAELAERTLTAFRPSELCRRPTQLARWVPRAPEYDVSFVVFGPDDSASRARRRVQGYADVTAVFARPAGVPVPPARPRLKRWVRGKLSRALLSRADVVLVETDAFATGIRKMVPAFRGHIEVVANAVNAAVTGAAGEMPALSAGTGRPDSPVRLLYVARAYPHKNHDFLGAVGEELEDLGVTAQFVVTLTEDEWAMRTPLFRRFAVNAGPQQAEELAGLYSDADAAIFPSLLEVYSATPLEAISLDRLVFASDRDFVRTSCRDVPIYFDPLDPAGCAEAIAGWIADPSTAKSHIGRGRDLVRELPTARDRALRYVEIISAQMDAL